MSDNRRNPRRRASIDNFMRSLSFAGKKLEKKKKKSVHFSATPAEVRPYHFDWNLEKEVFYSREELTRMAKKRFEEAAELKSQLGTMLSAIDDLVKPSGTGIKDLLQQAFGHMDEDTSIRGIEHFVYPQLQQEMVRRKKLVQNEVLTYARSREPDPQGWRLASQSRYYTQWARNIAEEKGSAYISTDSGGVHTKDVHPDVPNNKTELESIQAADTQKKIAQPAKGPQPAQDRGTSTLKGPTPNLAGNISTSPSAGDYNTLPILDEGDNAGDAMNEISKT